MRSLIVRAATAAVAGVLVLLSAGPATAAGEPDEHAPCLATVFQSQAVSGPRTVSDRILYIREFELQGDRFGQVLSPLTQFSC